MWGPMWLSGVAGAWRRWWEGVRGRQDQAMKGHGPCSGRSTPREGLQVSRLSPLPPHKASVLKDLIGHVPQEMWQL